MFGDSNANEQTKRFLLISLYVLDLMTVIGSVRVFVVNPTGARALLVITSSLTSFFSSEHCIAAVQAPPMITDVII